MQRVVIMEVFLGTRNYMITLSESIKKENYLCISKYHLSSSLSGYRFCYMFLCTYVYKFIKFTHNTYTNIL